jgi:flavin-dependent dehydrogenase
MAPDPQNADPEYKNTAPSIPASVECDVLVVGGGPAGSTAATLLARKGWSVIQVERDRHPRFHIGESLLPMNLPIFERLGVMDAVSAIGVKKLGADFPSGCPKGYNVFRFERALNRTMPYAYQVSRQDLDQLLFRNSASAGARTLENTRVTAVEFAGERVLARAEGSEREPIQFSARYVVDASGRDTLLGARLHLKRKHSKHQSAAIFAHFRGVERRSGEDEGNISVYRFEHGWVWMIPLRDELMSIGAVCSPLYLKQRQSSNAEFLMHTLRSIPQAAGRMQHASIVGNLHVTGNYSYECSAMTGHRWIMVGDAYAFLDPIFSSGVYLAMNSAELASEVIDSALRDPASERKGQQRYEAEIRRGLKTFSWFIYRFTSPAMRYLFANPRNDWRLEEALISMLSGDVFRTRDIGWRLGVFKAIYFITSLKFLMRSLHDAWRRRRQAHAVFTGGTTSQDSA